jgi:hypothetical protein
MLRERCCAFFKGVLSLAAALSSCVENADVKYRKLYAVNRSSLSRQNFEIIAIGPELAAECLGFEFSVAFGE